MNKELTLGEVLERAESFFDKKNYRLAKELFEKCPDMAEDLFFSKKIEICTEELNKEKAKNLIKKARKLLKKKRADQALEIFKEAYEFSAEEWIKQRIESLQGYKNNENMLKDAETAELNGDTARATDFYEKIFENDATPAILLRFLFNLVQDEAKKDDVSKLIDLHSKVFNDISELSEKNIYELGYIFAKTEKYSKALKAWTGVNSQNQKFLNQKNAVLHLWEKQIYEESQKTDNYEALRMGADDFLKYSSSTTVSDIAGLCKIKLAELCFQKQQYRSALNLLLPFPEKMDLEDVYFYSKIYYNIVKYSDDVDALDIINLCEFGFTVLFNESISGAYFQNEDDFDKIKEKVISEIIGLNKKYSGFASFYAFFLSATLEQLKQLFKDSSCKKLVLSPKIASLLGKCGDIDLKCDECLKHKKKPDGQEDQTDAIFATFPFIYHTGMQNGLHSLYRDNDKIYSLRNDMKKLGVEIPEDFLVKLQMELALIAYCENNIGDFEKYFSKTAPILYDKSILNFLSNILPPDILPLEIVSSIDKTLVSIAKRSEDEEILEICGRYTLRKILLQFDEGKIKPSLLKIQLEAVLSKIDTSEIQDDIDRILEVADIEKISEFFNKRKLWKAAEIAKESQFAEAENFFFEQISKIIFSTAKFEPEYISEMAAEFYKYAYHVDPSHEITKQLAKLKMQGTK